jgi:NADH:ubiquinone oxidoreductase subunit 4 (subunit M)
VREVAVLAPILALLLVFGVYPKLLTDRIDPTTTAVVQHVDPDHPTNAGPDVLASRLPDRAIPAQESP